MGKPRLIILIRHAQSEGNKNRDVHQTIPDHRVKLTQEGWAQARDAGHRLRKMLRPDDTLHFFTSPYRRTRETTEGILSTLTRPDDDDEDCGHSHGHDDDDDDDDANADVGPSPFQRSDVKVYEEPRLREQDFGNFQPCSAEMERMWQERADYGHFFYRIPNGESAADAYDRVSGFNESLWRQFGEDDFASVCVLVTHGLMSRVFLMKWYHFTVERFEDLRNVNHCEFLVMRRQEDSSRFLLETQLRTWSELRKERAALKDAAAASNGTNGAPKDGTKLDRNKSFAGTRRWGGCPNGCNHSRHYKRRDDLEVLRQKDADCSIGTGSDGLASGTTTVTTTTRRTAARQRSAISSDDDEQEGGAKTSSAPDADVIRTTTMTTTTTTKTKKAAFTVNGSEMERLSSPEPDTDGGPLRTVASTATEDERLTPSQRNSIVNAHHLHVHIGRDGGGTYSGHASTAGSDTEASEDDRFGHPSHHHHHHHHRRLASISARLNSEDGGLGSPLINGSSRLAKSSDSDEDGEELQRYASRLGDAPPDGPDTGSDGDDELARAERDGRSLRGSVY